MNESTPHANGCDGSLHFVKRFSAIDERLYESRKCRCGYLEWCGAVSKPPKGKKT